MHDVFRHIVLTTGDKNLLACDGITAIALRLGLGAHNAKVGAGVRLGQGHCSRPLARIELRQIRALLLRRTMGVYAQTGPYGQGTVQVEAAIRRPKHLFHHATKALWHALSAKLRITR